jgi:hypothetical protein
MVRDSFVIHAIFAHAVDVACGGGAGRPRARSSVSTGIKTAPPGSTEVAKQRDWPSQLACPTRERVDDVPAAAKFPPPLRCVFHVDRLVGLYPEFHHEGCSPCTRNSADSNPLPSIRVRVYLR